MHLATLCCALSLLGVEVGWEPLPEGGVEYVIQLEPQTLDSLRSGDVVRSYLKPEVKDVRAFRVQTGAFPPPRELPVAPAATSSFKPIVPQDSPVIETPPPRPWVALTLTMILLFGSIGLNVFLGWTSWDFRRRYEVFVTGSAAAIGKADVPEADVPADGDAPADPRDVS